MPTNTDPEAVDRMFRGPQQTNNLIPSEATTAGAKGGAINVTDELRAWLEEQKALQAKAVDILSRWDRFGSDAITLGDLRRVLAFVRDETPALIRKIEELAGALRGLLLSADASWEERREGHDWPDACEAARSALRAPGGGAT